MIELRVDPVRQMLALLAFSLLWNAVFAYQHTALIGIPKQFGFHHLRKPAASRQTSTAVIYAASGNVLSSSSPNHGGIVWRQTLLGDINHYQSVDERLLVQYANRSLALYSGTNGFLEWDWHASSDLKGSALVRDTIFAWTDSVVFVLESSSGQKRLSLESANTLAVIPSGILTVTNDGKVSFEGVDFVSGTKIASTVAVGSISDARQSIAFTESDRFVWLQGSNTIKSFCPSSKPSIGSYTYSDVAVLDSLSLEEKGYFLAKRADGAAALLKLVRDTCNLQLAWDFKDPANDAIYTSSIDRQENAHVARLTYSETLRLAMLSVFSDAPSALNAGGTGFVQGSSFAYDRFKHGPIIAGTTEVAAPDANADEKRRATTVHRSLWLSSSGSMQMWYAGTKGLAWKSEQGLASISKITWNDVSTAKTASVLTGQEGMLARWLRHCDSIRRSLVLSELLNLVRVDSLISAAQNFVKPSAEVSGRDEAWLSKSFGFRKMAIAASSKGKIFGLDVVPKEKDAGISGERILWETLVDTEGSTLEWHRIWVADVIGSKRVLAIGTVGKGAHRRSILHQLDALSGRMLSQRQISSAPIAATFALPGIGSKSACFALVDENKQLLMMSSDEQVSPPLQSEKIYFWTTAEDKRVLEGFEYSDLLNNPTLGHSAEPIWKLELPAGTDERIVSVIPQKMVNIASVGRIMGNRTTLYKLLNPHLVAIISASDTSGMLSVYVLDSVSGKTIFASTHLNVLLPSKTTAHLTENWLVYSFRDNGLGKRTRLVSVELFEGKDRPKKVKAQPRPAKRQDIQSSFEKATQAIVFSQSFIVPYGISGMSTTNTKFGVTRKALIVITDQNAVIAIPRRYLDPRRPLGKPTSYDAEEQLLPYDAVIPHDPKWVISQGSQYVSGYAPLISTSPTLLESTSLLLVAGLDLFSTTHLAPSGTFDVLSDDFNKVQLALVLGGLLTGISVVKPIVTSRRLKSKWYTQVQ